MFQINQCEDIGSFFVIRRVLCELFTKNRGVRSTATNPTQVRGLNLKIVIKRLAVCAYISYEYIFSPLLCPDAALHNPVRKNGVLTIQPD